MEDREVAGIRCSAVLARLSDYLDGELSPEDLASVQEHVTGCSNCARFGGRFARAVGLLRGLPRPSLSRP